MARKKARHFHCAHCGSECTIYKKGKKHRILVCPKHGILAMNPSVEGALSGAATGATIGSIIPGLGTAAGAAIGGAVGGLGEDVIGLFKRKKRAPEAAEVPVSTMPHSPSASRRPSPQNLAIQRMLYKAAGG